MKCRRCSLEEAAELLKAGEVVAFPTETVYGLGSTLFNETAISKIFRAKGRPVDNPLIVHISTLAQISLVAKEIPDSFYLLAEHFFPGPLTVILPKQERVPNIASASLSTIGVRLPAHPLAKELIELVGEPLVAPSANISGRPSSTTAQHVCDDFGDSIAGVLDGGPCNYGIESTVIVLLPQPIILRPGAICQKQIEQVLNCTVPYAFENAQKPASPGMKYRHYAPKARLRVFAQKPTLDAYLASNPKGKRVVLTSIKPSMLYALLRQADCDEQEEILILCDEEMTNDRALMNRISKASQ